MIFLFVVAGLVVFVRYLRQRELEAFKGTDLSALRDFTPSKSKTDEGPLVDVAELTAKFATLPSAIRLTTQPEFASRGTVLDDIHRKVLLTLDDVVGPDYRVFVKMPLTDFARIESGDVTMIGKTISYLVCRKPMMTVAFGVLFKGSGSSEVDRQHFIEELFRQIEKPLVLLPLASDISEAEIREKVSDAISASK